MKGSACRTGIREIGIFFSCSRMKSRFPDVDELSGIPSTSRFDHQTKPELKGKMKKREWFQSRYNSDNIATERCVKQKSVCKFFSSTGRCRNGGECPFAHERLSQSTGKIDQPCRNLYTSSRRCPKEDMCHFSHDLSRYPCPLMNAHKVNTCDGDCGFDHSTIVTETEAMRFVRTYHPFLVGLGEQVNDRWSFYLSDYDESRYNNLASKRNPHTVFNRIPGSLGQAHWY